ncbi:MAG: suppressor of fused domain protein [Candidatus Diapherotrites archaeon]
METKDAVLRGAKYESFWGRKPDSILHPDNKNDPHVDIFRFPPLKSAGFFKKLIKPVCSQFVYITGGMSDREMPVPKKHEYNMTPKKIELSAYSNKLYLENDTDIIASSLYFLSQIPFKEKMFLSVGYTVSLGKPIAKNTDLSAFFFGVIPSVNLNEICKASVNAEVILQVVPISEGELNYAKKEGSEKFLDYLEQNNIEPVFDLERKPKI